MMLLDHQGYDSLRDCSDQDVLLSGAHARTDVKTATFGGMINLAPSRSRPARRVTTEGEGLFWLGW